jgi:esterase/lipase superfamily enzyme
MNREYHKWWSPSLHREMELLVFGHGGMPMLVYPTSMGRFFEYEDRGMIRAIWRRFAEGHVQAFCVDSVDTESLYNRHIHPRHRIERHMHYENYILHEVLPFIRARNPASALAVTGCSFGGYHAANFAFRHPELVSHLISMSGAFDIHDRLDGYYDNDCYFNCPVDYLPNLHDDWYLSRFRSMRIVLGTSDWDICQDANWRMAGMLHAKGVPHWLDVWQGGHVHDWPLWQKMAQKYFT